MRTVKELNVGWPRVCGEVAIGAAVRIGVPLMKPVPFRLLTAGEPVKVYGVPQGDGSLRAYVLSYFTGEMPAQ